MKLVAFNGSPNVNGNTSYMIKQLFKEVEKHGIETELVQLGCKKIQGCIVCGKCFQNRDMKCANNNDILNKCIEKMIEADAIVIGSPTYFANVTTEVKALIDRAGSVAFANDRSFTKRKVGAAIVTVRRSGSINVFDAINKFFLINQMIVPGTLDWNSGHGFMPEDVKNDKEGTENMKILGDNIAWLLRKLL